jgi:hypothetical protein
MKRSDWKNDSTWLVNRSLFLLSLRSTNSALFFGGDSEDVEEALIRSKNSFEPEFDSIRRSYPKEFSEAYDLYFDSFGSKSIPYKKTEVRHGNPKLH